MPDYRTMYHALFNKITDTVEQLQLIQRQTEEMYMVDKEHAIELSVTKDQEGDSASTIVPN